MANAVFTVIMSMPRSVPQPSMPARSPTATPLSTEGHATPTTTGTGTSTPSQEPVAAEGPGVAGFVGCLMAVTLFIVVLYKVLDKVASGTSYKGEDSKGHMFGQGLR